LNSNRIWKGKSEVAQKKGGIRRDTRRPPLTERKKRKSTKVSLTAHEEGERTGHDQEIKRTLWEVLKPEGIHGSGGSD